VQRRPRGRLDATRTTFAPPAENAGRDIMLDAHDVGVRCAVDADSARCGFTSGRSLAVADHRRFVWSFRSA